MFQITFRGFHLDQPTLTKLQTRQLSQTEQPAHILLTVAAVLNKTYYRQEIV